MKSTRRSFLRTVSTAAAVTLLTPKFATGGAAVDSLAIEEATIATLQEALRSGQQTARSLVQLYLARIDQFDKRGPKINSMIELNPDAMEIAARLDEERKAGKVRGPLHGIPIAIKDNIDTADRMMTTAGSLALSGSIAPRDAFIVERLRAAGAIIIAKTNLSEWANFRSSRSVSGWSGRGGQTLNPYALDRNPCGSSSGSGAATAANLCAVSVGTETDGSIVCPSSANGLVGIKPTLGLVSRSGIIPISASQDTGGPMTRTVADAAAVLNALTGVDPRDPATSSSHGKVAADYTKSLDRDGLKGARLGIVRKSFGFNPYVDKLMSDAIAVLKGLGAIIIDPANVPTAGRFDDAEFQVLLYEFKAGVNEYLKSFGPRARTKSLKEIIAFNEENQPSEMPFFGQETLIKAEATRGLSDPKYRQALSNCRRLSRVEGIDAVMTKYRLDALIAPSGGPAWVIDGANGDHFVGGFSSAPAVAGYPHITVPAGFVFGLPTGISFAGRAWSEPTLIKLAYAFEQATRHRRAPQFAPKAVIATNGTNGAFCGGSDVTQASF